MAGKMLAPTNRAADTAAAKAAENEFWRLSIMRLAFLDFNGLSDDRSSVAEGWSNARANQQGCRENRSYGSRQVT
ncbi:hypothetical protein [uncultured Parasphingorhabdus sp.]|jgi:hypothetical protein|uniref:hypothetical protein n=1 Tax=uncultured Parasphingorhabdus sp. TaxID=2709694 RepID=UPI002AA78A4D|nr:hypothetical protein [uncultured Parasphingorhabdus sp.]